MNKLLLVIIHAIASTVLIGILLIIAFVAEFYETWQVLAAVVVGLAVSAPIAIVVTKKLTAASGQSAANSPVPTDSARSKSGGLG